MKRKNAIGYISKTTVSRAIGLAKNALGLGSFA